MNRVFLIGHIGQAPELKTTESGVMFTRFTMATNNRKKNSAGEWEDAPPDWHNVVVFGDRAASVADRFNAGDKVAIEGKLSVKQVEKDGQKKTFVDIIAFSVLMMKAKHEKVSIPKETEIGFSEDDTLPF